MNCAGCGVTFAYGQPGDLTPGCNPCYHRGYQARRKRSTPLDVTSPDWRVTNRDLAGFYDVLIGDPCSYCGGPSDVLDHIEPSCYITDSTFANMTAACSACNYGKRDRPMLHSLLWFRYAEEREQIGHLERTHRPTLQERSDRRRLGAGARRRTRATA